jgi:flagellar basal body-associated protein FliL
MRDKEASRFLSLILLIVAVFLVFIIASGTIWACSHEQSSQGAGGRGASGGTASISGKRLFSAKKDVAAIEASADAALFSDIGVLRASTADKNGAVIIVQPYFPYPSDDIAFREELVKKTRTIRSFMLDWFSTRTVAEIKSLGETEVKQALLDGVNGLLVLGKLDTVWFSEFMVLD